MPTRSTFDRSRPSSARVVTDGANAFKACDGFDTLLEVPKHTISVGKVRRGYRFKEFYRETRNSGGTACRRMEPRL